MYAWLVAMLIEPVLENRRPGDRLYDFVGHCRAERGEAHAHGEGAGLALVGLFRRVFRREGIHLENLVSI